MSNSVPWKRKLSVNESTERINKSDILASCTKCGHQLENNVKHKKSLKNMYKVKAKKSNRKGSITWMLDKSKFSIFTRWDTNSRLKWRDENSKERELKIKNNFGSLFIFK